MRLALALAVVLGASAPALAGPADTCPLKVGQTVPDARLKALSGADQALAELIKGRPTVLVFLRGGWCPYCNRQMAQLRQILPTLKGIGYDLLVVTGDPAEAVAKAVKDQRLDYTVLADPKGAAARAFGLAYPAGLAEFGHPMVLERWKALHPDEATPFLPVPAVYVVHPSGTVLYQYANIDYRVRLSAEVLLTVARAYAPQP